MFETFIEFFVIIFVCICPLEFCKFKQKFCFLFVTAILGGVGLIKPSTRIAVLREVLETGRKYFHNTTQCIRVELNQVINEQKEFKQRTMIKLGEMRFYHKLENQKRISCK